MMLLNNPNHRIWLFLGCLLLSFAGTSPAGFGQDDSVEVTSADPGVANSAPETEAPQTEAASGNEDAEATESDFAGDVAVEPLTNEAEGESSEVAPEGGDNVEVAALKNRPEQQEVARPQRVVLIEFHAEISSFSKEYLFRKLDKARELNPDVLVIEIDSPGGEIENTFEIGSRLRDIDWAKTVAFVPEQALSGAALFALGCDELVMAPNAVYGDAGPITLAIEDSLLRHAPEKIRSDLIRRARDLAESKGRSPSLVEAMIDMDLEVFETVHADTGERRYLSEDEIRATGEEDKWQDRKLVLESRDDLFLEVNGSRAVEMGLASINLNRREDLKQYLGPVDSWNEMGWNGLDTTVLLLNSPIVTAVLFVIGLIGLYIELASPGLGIGGVLAAVCFTMFFWSRFLGGTGEWLDVVLFLTGIALMLVEVFVIPGFGVWGIAGGLCVLASLVMASQSHFIPQTQNDLNQTIMWSTVTMGSMLAFLVVAGLITRRMGSIPILRGLLLEPPVESTSTADPVTETEQDGRLIRVGEKGLAESPLRPAGRILLDGSYIDAISDGSYIDAGAQVQVVDVRANRVVVRQI